MIPFFFWQPEPFIGVEKAYTSVSPELMTTKHKLMLKKHFVVSHHPLCPCSNLVVTIFGKMSSSVKFISIFIN